MKIQEKGDALVYREDHVLLDRDTDCFGCLKPASAALLMQHLAEAHASRYGNGRNDLLKTGAVWVLARTKARFSRLPKAGERLELVTWPGKLLRNLFPRYYAFQAKGERIGSAVTLWMLVDATTHLPTSPEKHQIFVTGEPVFPPPFEHPVRIREQGEPLYSLRRRCCYSDLDHNQHMNNARYLEWICDILQPARTPVGFQVNFLSEIREKDEIALNVHPHAVVTGYRADGVRAFEGRLEF
ncbi:MAG: acyl-[acyl-carrier-protein] thioesterase [Christensenellales bacterium]|jgi:medium-chain acyl-[acyl-carrier-protein] hydrolase